MSKIRRGGFVFVTWVGDHPPRHVHVYRSGRFVVKWDLDKRQAIEGTTSAKVRSLLEELSEEGLL
jgi:hypothetical protein